MLAPSVRCFVAVELPPRALQLLREVQQILRAQLEESCGRDVVNRLRWVSPEDVHLTLKFLGNVPANQVPDLEAALRTHLKAGSCCTIHIGGLGMFPTASRPRVIWVGVGGDVDSLAEVQHGVELATVPLGFPSEKREFSPHLTLARVGEDVDAASRRALGNAVFGLTSNAKTDVEIVEVSLMRSELLRTGARYSQLAAVPLSCRLNAD